MLVLALGLVLTSVLVLMLVLELEVALVLELELVKSRWWRVERAVWCGPRCHDTGQWYVQLLRGAIVNRTKYCW